MDKRLIRRGFGVELYEIRITPAEFHYSCNRNFRTLDLDPYVTFLAELAHAFAEYFMRNQ